MIAVAVLFFGGLAAAVVLWPKPICDRSGTSLYAVLLDATSALTEAQQLDISNKLAAFVNEMPVGGRLQFWQVAPTGSHVPMPLGEPICKPEPEPNPWIENVEEATKRTADFQIETKRLTSLVLVSEEQHESPILEGIQGVWLRYLGSAQFISAKDRHLLVVSDLVQHTGALSFYREIPSIDGLKRNQSYQRVKSSMTGTVVQILFLKHADGVPVDPLIHLWEAMLADMGAIIERVQRVVG